MKILKWVALFLFWVAAITLAGAAVGALAYPVFGPLFGFDEGVLYLSREGAKDIGFLSLIWAPASALVICLQKWNRGRSTNNKAKK